MTHRNITYVGVTLSPGVFELAPNTTIQKSLVLQEYCPLWPVERQKRAAAALSTGVEPDTHHTQTHGDTNDVCE